MKCGRLTIIQVWDTRKKAVVYSMLGHNDTITSLRVSPDSQTLLSNSMDSTVKTWDVRPFAPTDRHVRTFDGAHAGMEKNLIRASWDANGKKVAAGSADGTAVVWSNDTGKLMYKLPGHKGTVNFAELSPGPEPISKFTPTYDSTIHADNFRSPDRFFGPYPFVGRAQVRNHSSRCEN